MSVRAVCFGPLGDYRRKTALGGRGSVNDLDVLLMSGMMSTVILGEYNVQNRSTGF
jgi:hypothetical protein